MAKKLENLELVVSDAVAYYWNIREKQAAAGRKDSGTRSAVTGGAHCDGFIELFKDIIVEAGLSSECIFYKKSVELPGYFRPTKEWDLLAVKNGQLLCVLEVKSQVGPSFGNNFNNRTEEAMGSALDLWTAYREGVFNKTVKPWLGYMFMLEDCPQSQAPVKVNEPHFKVFPEFVNASYSRRYELFCRRLIRERQYTAAAFITSNKTDGLKGIHNEPAEDLTMKVFLRSLAAHITVYGEIKK